MSRKRVRQKLPSKIKKHKLLVQFIEYMIGGGVFFWTGYGTFALFYSGLQFDWLIAKMIGDAAGFSANYFIQRYWAFADPRLATMNRDVRRRYIVLSTIDFAIDYALVATLKHNGASPYIGFWVSAFFFTGWNYVFYRFWVFSPTWSLRSK
jgi:putative flippase GtrA